MIVEKMATPIQKLAQMSAKIFGMLSPEKLTKDHLAPLIHVMNNITSDDIHFDPKEIEERDAELQTLEEVVAPVTYMQIHQDSNFIMAVFVVKSGSVLPLHDHPRMFGLLKVIHGEVKIVSYTEVDRKPLPDSIGRLLTSGRKQSLTTKAKTVYRHNDILLSDKDDCCVLSPNVGNFHEIRPETKFAAFLDVLAPPYESDYGCHYYKDLNVAGKTDSTTWLIEVPQPASYWCDTIKYRGPVLT